MISDSMNNNVLFIIIYNIIILVNNIENIWTNFVLGSLWFIHWFIKFQTCLKIDWLWGKIYTQYTKSACYMRTVIKSYRLMPRKGLIKEPWMVSTHTHLHTHVCKNRHNHMSWLESRFACAFNWIHVSLESWI